MTWQMLQHFINSRMRLGAALVGLLSVFALSAGASENRTILLEEGQRGRMTIAAEVNGEMIRALVDTGATIPLIDEAYIGNGGDPLESVSPVNILGVGGQREYRRGKINELTIGVDRWSDLPVAVNEANREPVLQPILPVNLFETRVIDFDFAKQKLHLYNGRPRRARNAVHSTIKYERINDLLFVDVSINGVKGKALIDTGADVTFMTKDFARAAGGKIDEEQTQRIRGSDLNVNPAEIRELRDFDVGDMRIARVRLPALNTDLFRMIGVDHEYCMVLGMDYLQYYRLQIDRKRQEVRLAYIPDLRNSVAKRTSSATPVRTIHRR